MLQQGQFVGDLAYYYGEGAPATIPFWKKVRPEPPAGYNYDYVNTEVLLTRMSVKDGRIVLPDGMSYRVLVLPEDVDRLTPPVLRKIRDLVADGATVVAPRPKSSPSLTGYPAADDEVRAIANEVWGAIDGRSITAARLRPGEGLLGAPARRGPRAAEDRAGLPLQPARDRHDARVDPSPAARRRDLLRGQPEGPAGGRS